MLQDASGAAGRNALGEHRAPARTRRLVGARLPDGRYRLVVTATRGDESVTKAVAVIVDRTVVGLDRVAAAISPNGDGIDDTAAFSFTLGDRRAAVRIDVRAARPGRSPRRRSRRSADRRGAHTVSLGRHLRRTRVPARRRRTRRSSRVTDALGSVQIAAAAPAHDRLNAVRRSRATPRSRARAARARRRAASSGSRSTKPAPGQAVRADVDPDPEHDALGRLGEDAGHLAAVDEHVVRVLDRRRRARSPRRRACAATSVSSGQLGDRRRRIRAPPRTSAPSRPRSGRAARGPRSAAPRGRRRRAPASAGSIRCVVAVSTA